ncbi:MAG: thioredoxin family protein [Spirochaetales bacterium]|nr:thioredoxin family protein [Spirochaetales bacterium]
MKYIIKVSIVIFLFTTMSCGKSVQAEVNEAAVIDKDIRIANVTFIELGSVNCIPCKMMQPVMEQVETDFGEQVEVIFHDVWTEAGEPYGLEYKIKAIPTQIFLDKEGNEYYRHVGFFPQEELYKILEQGLEQDL